MDMGRIFRCLRSLIGLLGVTVITAAVSQVLDPRDWWCWTILVVLPITICLAISRGNWREALQPPRHRIWLVISVALSLLIGLQTAELGLLLLHTACSFVFLFYWGKVIMGVLERSVK
jgi:hypothetical protein